MKQLRRIHLINWHRFSCHTVNVDGNLLLIGNNGSGKSSILDAVQVGLVGNMTGVRLNRSANERGNRDLASYVRGLVSFGGAETRKPRYLRADATAYVLLEFADAELTEEPFVLGTIIDGFTARRSPEKGHFIAGGLTIEELPCLNDRGVPRTVREFRRAARDADAVHWCTSVEEYQQRVLQKLGGLSPDFFRLFVRAIAFQRIGRLRDFVYDYLLSESPDLGVDSLRQAADQYRQLHELAVKADDRIARLDRILQSRDRIDRLNEEQQLFEFLTARSQTERARMAVTSAQAERDQAAANIESIQGEYEASNREVRRSQEALDALRDDLRDHTDYGESRRLRQQAEQLRRRLEDDRREEARMHDALCETASAVTTLREFRQKQARSASKGFAQSVQRDLPGQVPGTFPDSVPVDLDPASGNVVETLDQTVRAVLAGQSPSPQKFRELEHAASWWDEITDRLRRASFQLEAEREQCRTERQRLDEERQTLQSGRRRYPPATERLRELLAAELSLNARVLCEMLEISDPDWQGAIEAYLGPRRFDVLVPPGEYRRALKFYAQKRESESLGEVGLVDTASAQKSAGRRETGSLAEKVTTENASARGYVDHLLGHVIGCVHENHLQDHEAAVTRSGLVYENHAHRHLGFEDTGEPADKNACLTWCIGSRGLAARTADLETRLADVTAHQQRLDRLRESLNTIIETLKRGREGVGLLSRVETLAADIRVRSQQLHALQQRLDDLQAGGVDRLQTLIREAETDHRQWARREKETFGRLEVAKRELELAEQRVHRARESAERAESLLNEQWPTGHPLRQAGEERYRTERERRSETDVERLFAAKANSHRSEVETRRIEGIELRSEYNSRFDFPGDLHDPTAADYQAERHKWKETLLPEYQDKIANARRMAQQALEEEVIHRLRERLRHVQREFDRLNGALEGLDFSGRTYRFLYRVRPEYRTFYDMIVQSGELDERPLAERDWYEQYGWGPLQELLDELLAEPGGRGIDALEQRTDYRAYFDYDIEITDAQGHKSLFSRSSGSGSGGETQTPYYVAMLASLARLYRSQEPSDGTSRAALVAFDEPFQKMDEYNIAAALRLARRLGLQLLLATPKERCHQMLPAVGRTTCMLVLRDGDEVHLEPFQRNVQDNVPDEAPPREGIITPKQASVRLP